MEVSQELWQIFRKGELMALAGMIGEALNKGPDFKELGRQFVREVVEIFGASPLPIHGEFKAKGLYANEQHFKIPGGESDDDVIEIRFSMPTDHSPNGKHGVCVMATIRNWKSRPDFDFKRFFDLCPEGLLLTIENHSLFFEFKNDCDDEESILSFLEKVKKIFKLFCKKS